ncbi:uncharacterized protein LOC121649303 isoform X2 [Melanotaenia boesemani]|uniref:uncharacterized protein LOC121649303 isoform X2 n=1 Tax=Melanotaenia boesemani TaxID=1250792 RepID=UPI001C05421D|nr:uncharacterized protein LOC121649303 isoform X2 [Melanotaenia boesemani]
MDSVRAPLNGDTSDAAFPTSSSDVWCTHTYRQQKQTDSSYSKLEGQQGSMTSSQKVYLFLGVFLSTINLLKGGCEDYFALSEWHFLENFNKSIALINANKSEDIVRCSLRNFWNSSGCTEGNLLCWIYEHCGYKNETNFEDNCLNESLGNVTMFHIRCIVAKERNKTNKVSQECGDYDQLFNLYPKIFPKPEDGTTTTMKSTTTEETPRKAQSNTTSIPTTCKPCVTENLAFIIFLIVSVILNIILLINMYSYHRKKRGRSLQSTQNGIHEMTDNLTISETTSLNMNRTMANLDSNGAMHQRFTTPPSNFYPPHNPI